MSKLRPFYTFSCAAVHGGPKGFFRLGLDDEHQDEVLLVGPSVFGLADPLQNTAISLNQVNVCLLGLNADYEKIVQMKVSKLYVEQILSETIKVHEALEKKPAIISK